MGGGDDGLIKKKNQHSYWTNWSRQLTTSLAVWPASTCGSICGRLQLLDVLVYLEGDHVQSVTSHSCTIQPNRLLSLSLSPSTHVSVSETESNPLVWVWLVGHCWHCVVEDWEHSQMLDSVYYWPRLWSDWMVPAATGYLKFFHLCSPPSSSSPHPPLVNNPLVMHPPVREGEERSQHVLFIHVHTGNQLQQLVQGRYAAIVCVCV